MKIAILFLAAVMAMSALIIISGDGRVPAHPADQAFVSTADLRIGQNNGIWYFHYPFLRHTGGITGTLTVGLYKLIIPTTPENLNYHIKIFAMSLFFLFGYLLASQYLKTLLGLILFIAVIATSGLQLIEPTGDLIAGIYLIAFLYAITKGWHFILSTFLLACFALCRGELLVVSLPILLYWVLVTPSKKLKIFMLVSFLFWVIVFIAPGLYLSGAEAIMKGGKLFNSFRDSYVHLMVKYKQLPIPQNFDLPRIIAGEFPGTSSLADIIVRYPQKYFFYMLICILTNLLVFIRVFKGIAGVLVLRWAHYKDKVISNHFEPLVWVGFITLFVSHTFVAAFRVKYLIKFFIPLVLIGLIYWEYCRERSEKPVYLWQARLIITLIIVTILLQLAVLRHIAGNPYIFDFIG